MPFQQPRQKLLVNRDLPVFQTSQLTLVVIDHDDVVAHVGETSPGHQSNVSRSYNRDAHSNAPRGVLARRTEGRVNWTSKIYSISFPLTQDIRRSISYELLQEWNCAKTLRREGLLSGRKPTNQDRAEWELCARHLARVP